MYSKRTIYVYTKTEKCSANQQDKDIDAANKVLQLIAVSYSFDNNAATSVQSSFDHRQIHGKQMKKIDGKSKLYIYSTVCVCVTLTGTSKLDCMEFTLHNI